MKKILVATEKPFAPAAVEGIKKLTEEAGYEFALLEKYTDKSQFLDAVKDANALIIRSDKVTPEVIEAAKELEIVVRGGAGYDNVNLEASTAKNVVVMNTPGQNSNAVAELALGFMVYGARNFYNGKAGSELLGKKLGILAFGHIGRLVAKIAKGFGMEVYAFDAFVPAAKIEEAGVKAVGSAEELFKMCQYVSLHIPANEQTKKSINYDLMKTMPQGATIVNTARKEVMNEEDVLKIMAERADFNYISDIAPDNKADFAEKFDGRYFFSLKKMGAQTGEANVNAGIAAINQIVKFFKNGDTTFKVN
jgi:D-3-phosphoglycerate dehydrogenase / 2-oxoglutarate reductase